MMKKWICLALCLLMVSGCALAYDGTAPIGEEPITISVLTTNGASLLTDFANMTWWQEALKRANVVLEVEMVDPSSYADVIKPRLAAGIDLPDLINVGSNDADMAYINSGLFLDLTEYYDTMAFNLNKRFEEHPTLKSQLTTPDGSIYYIPYIYTTDSNMRTMMLNAQFVEAVGMTMEEITDIDSYTEYLYKVKEMDANGNGDPDDEIPWGGSWSGAYAERDPIFYALGYAVSGNLAVDHTKETPDIVYVPYEAQYKDYLLYMNDLWNEGLLDPDMFTQAETQVQATVLEGTIGFCAMSAPYVYVPDTKDNWVAINAMSKEEGGLRIYPAANPVYIPAIMVINADCDEETAAALAALADEMYSVEWYGWSMYGPEAGSDLDYFGTGHYVEDGVVKYNMPDDMTNEWQFRCTYLTIWALPDFNNLQCDPYYQLYAEQFPDTQLGQLFATGNYFEDWQPNFIETYQPYYAESIPTFYFTEDDLDRINTLQTPLDDYVASMEAKFITGEISIEDEYDNFVATLEEYGVQEYVELYNSYYGD